MTRVGFSKNRFIGRPLAGVLLQPATKIRLICPATAWDRSCTDEHPTHAGPLEDYLEISYWPVPSSVGRAPELLAHKLVEGRVEGGRVKRDPGETNGNVVCDCNEKADPSLSLGMTGCRGYDDRPRSHSERSEESAFRSAVVNALEADPSLRSG